MRLVSRIQGEKSLFDKEKKRYVQKKFHGKSLI